jgi:hypothetical protein
LTFEKNRHVEILSHRRPGRKRHLASRELNDY